MPIDIASPVIPAVYLDSEPLKIGTDALEEAYALALVKETFNQYENFRSQYHDIRWNVSDSLYFGWLPAKTWEGTVIPRAALGMPIVFDQIEAALPAITQELFVPQDEWFQVETEPGAEVNEARQVQEHLSYVLEHCKNDVGLTARNELELALKSTLLYGNGGIYIEYDSILKRPIIEWVDTRDFYTDPGCAVPNVDESRSVIRRKFMTVEELISYRQDKRMKIPSDEVLYHMSNNPLFAVGDQTKRTQEQIRGVSFTPGVTDYSPYPADRKIEVLLYYSESRIIWTLNREWVAYNETNPYGFIPFCFAPCYIVPGRFYAQSMADVQEGNQRYIEALLNARLDAVSLEIQPPRVYKAGTMMTPAQLKWRPGAMFQTHDVKDMSLLQPTTQMANVYSEISFIKDAAEQRTGVNSMTSGIPRPSNTNRTATGVSAVKSGTMSRLRQLVANFENYLIVPMLYKLYEIIQKHTLPDTGMTGISKTGQLTNVNSSSFQGKMRFRMLSSSRMLTREKLQQIFPFLTQYMLNGTFLGEVQKSGKTIDFNEMFMMLRDATGTGRLYNFIRDMNDQEKQAMQQPDPKTQQAQQQAQAEQQTRLQMGQMKSQTDLQVAQIQAQPKPTPPPDPAELQQEREKHQMEMERDASRMKSEQMLAQIKVAAQQEDTKNKAIAHQQEMAFKHQELLAKLHGTHAETQMNIQQQAQQAQIQNQQAQDTHAQGISQQADIHQQTLENMKAKNTADMDHQRKKAQIKTKNRGPKA